MQKQDESGRRPLIRGLLAWLLATVGPQDSEPQTSMMTQGGKANRRLLNGR